MLPSRSAPATSNGLSSAAVNGGVAASQVNTILYPLTIFIIAGA